MPGINWNYLNQYLSPLSENLTRGVQNALQNRRFNRSFAESKRRYDEGAPGREIEREKMRLNNAKMKEAQKAYQFAMYGKTGEVLDQPADLDRLLKSEIARSYLNLPAMQRRGVVTSEGGRPVQKFVDPLQGGSYPVYEKPVGINTTQGGQSGTLYTNPAAGQFYPAAPQQYGPEIGETQTIQQGTDTVTYQWNGSEWQELARGPKWNPATNKQNAENVPDEVKMAQQFVLRFASQSQNPMLAALIAMNPGNASNPAFQSMLRNDVPPQYQQAFDYAMAIINNHYSTQTKDIPASQGGSQVTSGDDFLKKHKLK